MSDEAFEAALAAQLGEADQVEESTTDDAESSKADDKQEETASREAIIDLDDAEIEARAKGWNPDKEAYEKATGKKWSSAETFLAKREMGDEISKRGRELKQVRKEMEQMRKLMESRIAQEVESRVAALKKERADAIREQDFEEIDRLDNEIEAARKPAVVEQEQDDDQDDKPEPGSGYIESPAQVMRYVEKWKRDTAPWFDKANDKIKAEALRIEQLYMGTYPNSSIEDSLAYVQEQMTKRFPELGAVGKKPQTGGAPRGGSGSGAVDESSLSAEDKQILRLMEKQGAFKDAKDRATFIRENFGA